MAAAWTQVGARSATSVQALTEAAPALDTDGVNLHAVGAVAPVVHAPVGQTIAGGLLLAYVLRSAGWVRLPRADLALDEVIGLQDGTLPAVPVSVAWKRFAWIASGITLSGAGTQVNIDLDCMSVVDGGRFE